MKSTSVITLLFFAYGFAVIGLGEWIGKGEDGFDSLGDTLQLWGFVAGLVIYILYAIWERN